MAADDHPPDRLLWHHVFMGGFGEASSCLTAASATIFLPDPELFH